MNLEELYERYSTDPLFDDLRQHAFFVPGMGPSDKSPDLMLIGEAPGSLENAKRLPFQGTAGQRMSNLLHRSGIELDPENIFVTNVVKYWPQKTPGQTRKPTNREIAASKTYLVKEIEAVNPKIIGLMGYVAITTIYPSVANVYDVNGIMLDDKYVPLYHPIAAVYNTSKERQVEEGYEALARYLKELKN